MARKILVTGGIKSGKSRIALKLASDIESGEKFFIATARAIDPEMQEKIAKHKGERGNDFRTQEEPIHLGAALRRIDPSTAVVDCLTLWVSNLLFELSEEEKLSAIEDFFAALREASGSIIIVTNEVGWGIIPSDEVSRQYQNELGTLNQQVAQVCDEVYVMFSGIRMRIK